ncbi:MAG TPA: hypothetical protein VMH00_17365 [Candidatus Limnocylindrales bacterium]|nr:hypothetical protein [Candidatus Limnocylindrales bacterium]
MASIALAQQTADAPREEVVADLAAGRVVIAVVKDSILVATVENPIEAQTRPPIPVQLSSERLAVVLGAIDWFSPSSRQDFARIDQELPRLRGRVLGGGPHISQTEGGSEASDIEVIGQGLLTRLNTVAGYLHSKIEQPAEDPLTELVIADYLTGYGPEVWQVTYNIDQEQQQGDYWDTRVMRPQYLQFWPPEKGQPRTLVEFAYPPENPPTPLLDLLRARDPRLEKVLASDSKMAEVATRFIEGDSKKIRSEDALQFLRAALAAIAPPDARQTFATIGEESGFAWVLQPPQEPAHGRQVASSPQQTGAPSLLKHPN